MIAGEETRRWFASSTVLEIEYTQMDELRWCGGVVERDADSRCSVIQLYPCR